MHCCLAVGAAANVSPARPESRALRLPILKDRGTASSAQTTANDGLVHFMAQLPLGRKPINFVDYHFRVAAARGNYVTVSAQGD